MTGVCFRRDFRDPSMDLLAHHPPTKAAGGGRHSSLIIAAKLSEAIRCQEPIHNGNLFSIFEGAVFDEPFSAQQSIAEILEQKRDSFPIPSTFRMVLGVSSDRSERLADLYAIPTKS
jgi:hypothetical protein